MGSLLLRYRSVAAFNQHPSHGEHADQKSGYNTEADYRELIDSYDNYNDEVNEPL